MPTAEDIDNTIVEPVEDTPPAGTTPNVSIDMDALQRNISSGIAAGFQSMMSEARRNQPVQPVNDPSLTELQIGEDDDENTKMRKVAHNAQIPLRREMAEFRQYGLGKLTDLTSRAAASELPYYTKYKAEIETQLQGVDPSLRADMQTLRLVHNNVVANHIDEIAEERAQEKAKTLLQNSKLPKPNVGGRGSVVPDENAVPTPEDLFGEDQIEMINEKGGAENWVKRMGWADWATYAKAQQSLKATPKKEGGRVIPFARFERGKKKA